jgi:hypothetical protein
MAGETVTDPADLVREACDLLAGYLPELERHAPEPDAAASAAAGMTARPPAAPLPGNAAAIYALTGIHATARQLEGVLKYAAGARRPGPLAVRGGSDANTAEALAAITSLIDVADDDLYRTVITELDQRLDEARKVRAIDEAEEWRPVRSRACPYCGCYFLKVLLDAAKRPAGRIECFGHREDGAPCRAAWASLADIVPDLARADETVPDLEGC